MDVYYIYEYMCMYISVDLIFRGLKKVTPVIASLFLSLCHARTTSMVNIEYDVDILKKYFSNDDIF